MVSVSRLLADLTPWSIGLCCRWQLMNNSSLSDGTAPCWPVCLTVRQWLTNHRHSRPLHSIPRALRSHSRTLSSAHSPLQWRTARVILILCTCTVLHWTTDWPLLSHSRVHLHVHSSTVTDIPSDHSDGQTSAPAAAAVNSWPWRLHIISKTAHNSVSLSHYRLPQS